MAVDRDTVTHIARLARIRIDDAQRDALADELSDILAWIEQLGEVDTEGVAPMTSVVAMAAPMREDRVTDGDQVDDILKNAPESAHGFYVVPKVVE